MADRQYTTEEKIEAYLGGIAITTGGAANYILAAQKLIEQLTNRVFKAESTASIRLFDGNDKQYLDIDDCVEVTKVEVGNDGWGDSFTEILSTGINRYYTLPNNNLSDEVPIRRIGLRSRLFIIGNANHRITAKWGYSASVPDDISFAATVIAAGMYYQNRGGKTGPVKSERIGEYQVTYADQGGVNDLKLATEILQGYKKYLL